MHIRVVAIGDRQPDWVTDACDDYAARLPANWAFRVTTLAAARRGRQPGDAAKNAEGEAIVSNLGGNERLIALDEHGRQRSSSELADWLASWQADGRDVCLAIGGPDGLSAGCLARAEGRWSLSKLTLPHGLARVLVLEQLYRAWSLGVNHPYHRA